MGFELVRRCGTEVVPKSQKKTSDRESGAACVRVMATKAEDPKSFVTEVRLQGGGELGLVKSLSGFKKGRHAVPDAVNAATEAFLGRLCMEELGDESEEWFQRARADLGYKRKQVTLEVAGARAVLSAVDFTFEISYTLESRDPGTFVKTRILHQLTTGKLGDPQFEELFAGQFDEIVFELTKGARVEAVIDAVEELDGAGGLRVNYPSDCRECTLTVEGVEAEVVCDGATLLMRFPRAGGPMELVEAFGAVRRAFSLSKKTALAGLLG